jgi:hypothetical protein
MATTRRLTRVVPIRVSRDDRALLRRLARERGTDVSKVVRGMIEEWRQREAREQSEETEATPSNGSTESSGVGASSQVGAAA